MAVSTVRNALSYIFSDLESYAITYLVIPSSSVCPSVRLSVRLYVFNSWIIILH